MYCTTAQVYAVAGLTNTVITTADVTQFILEAEEEVDRLTNTTYWAEEDSGTATGNTSTSLSDSSKTWTTNTYANEYLWLYGGTGLGQMKKIVSNNATALTVESAWGTNPGANTTYRIIHTGVNPHIDSTEGLYDGDDTDTFYLPKYPLRILSTVTVDSTSVTPAYIYQYKNLGKLVLNKSSAEVSYFTSKAAQLNVFDYWYGVYPLPLEIKRLVEIMAAMKTFTAQMGGTYAAPSTYTTPEGSVTVGQAYINIKSTWDTLVKERDDLINRIIKYPSFG